MKKVSNENKHWYSDQIWVDWNTIEDLYESQTSEELTKICKLAEECLNYIEGSGMETEGLDLELVESVLKYIGKNAEISFGRYKVIKFFLGRVMYYRKYNG